MIDNKSYKRTRNLFDPRSKTPFKLSRSRLENFLNCPRCFYLDRRLGIEPPGMPPFTLNSAVDELFKKEFDVYRRRHEIHPLMEKYGIEAVPFVHPFLDEWRENFKGIQYHHKETNMIFQGAVDDVWVDKKGLLYIVDYKATSTNNTITLDDKYKQAYKRQMEIYQWLFRQNNFKVSDTGYFVFCNADKTKDIFGGILQFKLEIIPYKGSCQWVEGALIQAHQCLMSEVAPEYSKECEYCQYLKEIDLLKPQEKKKPKKQLQGELFSS